MARSDEYNEYQAGRICELIATSTQGLRAICAENYESGDVPKSPSTVYKWLSTHTDFAEQYARAREAQAHLLAEEQVEIADDGRNDWMERHGENNIGWQVNGEHVQRSKLRIDTRKWIASKLHPKVYGERTAVDLNGSLNIGDADEGEIMAKIEELITRGILVLPAGVELLEVDKLEDDGSDLV